MTNKTKTVLGILGFAFFIMVASILYNTLSKQFAENPPTESKPTSSVASPNSEADVSPAAVSSAAPESKLFPDFTVYDIDGNAVKLSDYRGKKVVLNVWASWCPPCVYEMPFYEEAISANEDPDLVFLMINATDGAQETVEVASAFMEENGYTFPILFDSDRDFIKKYYVRGIPVTILIDAEGNKVFEHSGMFESTEQLLETLKKLG